MVGQKSTKAQSVFFHIFSCLLGFIMVYPLLWLLMSSFKSNDTMFHNAWSLIPEKWAAVTNYLSGFEGVAGIPFWRFFANSAIVTVVSVVGSIFCSLLAAYALSRLKFKGSGFWFGCVVMTMMIPSQVMVVPQYIILKHLGLSDTLVSMTLPWVFGHGFFIFLIAQYMRDIPRDLDEAAMLDGEIGSLSTPPSELYLYSGGQLVYSSSGSGAAFTLPESGQGYRISTLGGKKYFLCWMTSRLTGMRLCSVFDYNQIYGQTSAARNALIAGECAILLLFAWVLLRMARFVTRPIHTLSEAVQVVEGGDFAAARALLPADPAGDEVGALTREFDVMLRQIDTLIHENYEKQLMLQETRYKMLQAQINPHFLYNTLSTLNWLVRAGDREDACRMIVSLGDILRAALSPRDNSTAAADVQLARSYIDIQQLRYKNRAVFTLTAEGDLEHWYLPHFTLQPLVENAIHYGVEQSETICHVDVCAVAAGGVLTLTVHNTGVPVPPERLAAIRAFTVKPQGHGIGLKNIYERLAMLYRDFTFDFDSTAQAGTTVRIVLRQEERREESI